MKAILVDDEKALLDTNLMLLKENFPSIEVVGTAGNVNDAIQLIKSKKPDLLLLDIELIGGTGFNVLQETKPWSFLTIFITAFNQYAIKAIKYSALDYILKPVNEFEFCNAIQTAIETFEQKKHTAQLKLLMENIQSPSGKIVLRTAESVHVVDVQDIMYCKSDNSYTTFYLNGQHSIMVSKGLKEYEELLDGYGFLRPHQSFLVNLNYIQKVDKSDGGFVILKNGKELPVSSRRKAFLMQTLEKL